MRALEGKLEGSALGAGMLALPLQGAESGVASALWGAFSCPVQLEGVVVSQSGACAFGQVGLSCFRDAVKVGWALWSWCRCKAARGFAGVLSILGTWVLPQGAAVAQCAVKLGCWCWERLRDVFGSVGGGP